MDQVDIISPTCENQKLINNWSNIMKIWIPFFGRVDAKKAILGTLYFLGNIAQSIMADNQSKFPKNGSFEDQRNWIDWQPGARAANVHSVGYGRKSYDIRMNELPPECQLIAYAYGDLYVEFPGYDDYETQYDVPGRKIEGEVTMQTSMQYDDLYDGEGAFPIRQTTSTKVTCQFPIEKNRIPKCEKTEGVNTVVTNDDALALNKGLLSTDIGVVMTSEGNEGACYVYSKIPEENSGPGNLPTFTFAYQQRLNNDGLLLGAEQEIRKQQARLG